jgi:hypothetical protein
MALALALAYLGTLAAACFALWLRVTGDRRTDRDVSLGWLNNLEERLKQVESALASPQEPPDYAEIRETVSTLALASGMRRKGRAVVPPG